MRIPGNNFTGVIDSSRGISKRGFEDFQYEGLLRDDWPCSFTRAEAKPRSKLSRGRRNGKSFSGEASLRRTPVCSANRTTKTPRTFSNNSVLYGKSEWTPPASIILARISCICGELL